MPGPAVYGGRALAGRPRAGHVRPLQRRITGALQGRGYQLCLQYIRGRLAGGAGGGAGGHTEGRAAAEGTAAEAGDGTQRAHTHCDERCVRAGVGGAGCGLQQAGGVGGTAGHNGQLGNVGSGVGHAGQGVRHGIRGGRGVKVMLAEKRCGPGGVGCVAQLGAERAAGPPLNVQHVHAAACQQGTAVRGVGIGRQGKLTALGPGADRDDQRLVLVAALKRQRFL